MLGTGTAGWRQPGPPPNWCTCRYTRAGWIEIYFSILQRKVLTSNELTDLDARAERVPAFQARYNATAQPVDWKFSRTDLLLHRIAAHETANPPAVDA